MNFRFRKSFTIIPGILRWTVSKKSTSLNLNLGLFSKSWGTRGTTTTIDAPGTTGIFWRREHRRGGRGAAKQLGHESVQRDERAGIGLFALALIVQGVAYWAWSAASCTGPAHSHALVFVLGLELIAYVLGRMLGRVGPGVNFLLVALLVAGGYVLAHSFIAC
jgi:hypothetical protein